MSDLLSGLDSLGLGDLEDMKLYEKSEKKSEVVKPVKKVLPKKNEKDFLFEKSFSCTVCGKEFKSLTVKSGKAKLLGTDPDLRPRYESIDTLKYDIVACPHCGYAALSRNFQFLVPSQKKAIAEKIGAAFKMKKEYGEVLSYEEALERYKLALLSTIVKNGKASEKAFICLKTAWILRGKAENLEEDKPDYAENKKALEVQEKEFLKNALDGFVAARQSEEYPMCGMDESTVDYLIASTAIKFGQYDLASKLVGTILTSMSANARMKDKARDLKDELLQKIRENKEA